MKQGDKYRGNKIIQVFEVPKWFLTDINVSFNAVLKHMKVDAVLTTHKLSEIRGFVDKMKHLNREEMSYIKSYLRSLKSAVWDRYAIMYPKARDYDAMVYDPDDMKIYAVDEAPLPGEKVTTVKLEPAEPKPTKATKADKAKADTSPKATKEEEKTIKALKPNPKK